MSEAVLPLIRTKRKRRKPPRPMFWVVLFLNVAVLADMGLFVYVALTGQMTTLCWFLLAGLSVGWRLVYWPWLQYEIRIWKRDDE